MNLKTVRIEKIEKHPGASKLKVCTVNDGAKNYTVVCGAANARQGLITILAPPGSTTPEGQKIEQADLRGITSQGMLCSPKELNVSSESGIVDLPPATDLGINFQDLSTERLSSTPWYSYKEVESFWEVAPGKIQVCRFNEKTPSQGKLLSKTYFTQDHYTYRHF